MAFSLLAVVAAPAQADPITRLVDTTGSDTGDCSVSPCLTINYAVGQAVSGDTVQVAAGAYPEMVTVDKSLVFQGANAGQAAGVTPGTRSAESVVKGFRNPGVPHPTSAYEFSTTIDGFTIDPQGDAALIAAGNHHLVALFGGPDVKVQNNIFDGGPYDPGCGYTCTTMTDSALFVQSGNFEVSANTFTNFRAPIDISQNDPAHPIVSGSLSSNTFTHITNRAIWLREGGTATSTPTFPGVTVFGNNFDATGWVNPDWSPGGIIITTGGNNVAGNTFTNFGSGVFVEVCDGNPVFTATNTFTHNSFLANASGVQVFEADTGCTTPVNATINNNNFVGNYRGGVRWNGVPGFVAPNTLNAMCNWWGAAGGAGSAGADTATASVNARPWNVAFDGRCDGGIPTLKTDCKTLGWKLVVDRHGLPFVSQSDCIKAVEKVQKWKDKGTAAFELTGMSGTRKANHLGVSAFVASDLVITSILETTVGITYTNTITAVNGDTVITSAVATIDITNVVLNNGLPLPVTAVETVTGGTGRFFGASGSFTMTGTVDLNAATLVFKSAGTIKYSKRGCVRAVGSPC